MPENPERKAALDKDGIPFEGAGKAELDKEGITFISENVSDREDAPKVDQDTPAGPTGKNRLSFLTSLKEKLCSLGLKENRRLALVLTGGVAGLVTLLVIGGFALHHAFAGTPEKTAKAVPSREDPLPGSDGGIVLDPFLVFSDTHDSKRAGVVIAQISLKVDPEVVPTVEGRLFDIRDVVFKRLSSAANVYAEPEIAKMLSEDLEDFQVKQVSFIQYQTR